MGAVTEGDEDRYRWSDWPLAARRVVTGLALVLVVVVGVVIGGVVVARNPLPRTDGTVRLPGLQDTVRAVRDEHGIPQVYADTAHDLFYAQGYVQAQDRFFQMDFRRHVTAGRLSELFGKATLSTDMFVRTMGWRRVAELEYDLLSPETRDYLWAYSDGVNAWLKGRGQTDLSLEYTVLGLSGLDYRPEKWTPVDSLAWLKAMAWDLRGNMDEEIDRARLSVSLTPAQVAELYPAYPYARHAPILDAPGSGDPPPAASRPGFGARTGLGARLGARAGSPDSAAERTLAALQRGVDAMPELMGRGSGLGSNSWVVDGRHTETGEPLLANDPHLGTTQPGIWYQMGLHCTRVSTRCPFDVSGFSFSGVPGVVIGHNRDVAWGFTNLNPDVTDLYLEKLDGQHYLSDGKELPLAEREEVIRVRGAPTKMFKVRSTGHGPLLSDVSGELSSVGANAPVPTGSPERGNGYAVALAWTALTPRPTMDALFLLDRAEDWADFRAAAAQFAVPSQNLVYADTAGNIGYQAPGAVPIRPRGDDGDLPVPGWTSAHDWRGEVPFERLPSELNPPEGFIVTANQAVTQKSSPVRLGNSWDYGWRSQRIRDLLTDRLRTGKVGLAGMAAMQVDTRNPIAPQLVPLIEQQQMSRSYYAHGQQLLARWDYTQPADSAAAAYFNAVWSNLLRLTFDDQLPTGEHPDGGDRWMEVMSRLLREPTNPWWDDTGTDQVEDRDMVLGQAMRDATDELVRNQSVNPSRWQWGRSHRLILENQSLGTSGIGPVERLFNRGPWPAGGGTASVDSTNWDAGKGYDITSGPSMRMVVDLADLDRSRWVNISGESGHVMSANYDDQTSLWLAGRTLPWAFGPDAVRRHSEHTLTLRPLR